MYDDLQSENKLSDQDGNKNVVSKNSGSADGKETSDGNEDGHTNTQANHEWGKGRIDRSLLNDLISQINDHGNDEGEVNGSDHTYNNGHKGERRDETAVDEDSVDNDDDKSDLDDGYELLHTHIQPSPIKVSVRGIMNSMEDVDKKDNRDQSARIEEADIVINQTHSERYNDNTDDNDNDDSCDNNNQQQKNSDENSPRDETGRGTKRTSQKNVNKVGRLLVCSSSAGKISSRSKSTSNNSIKIINSTPARVRSTSKKKARNRSRSNSTKRSVASRPASASYISTASSYSKKSSLKAKSLSRTSKSKSKSLKQKATRVERRSLAKTPNRMSLTSKIRRLPVRMSATHSRNTRDADTTQVRSSKSAKNRLASTSIKKARAFKVRTLKHMTPHKSIQSADDCESTKRTLRMNSPGDHDSNSSDTTCGENTGTVCLTLPSHNPALHFESSLGNSTHGTEERTRSGGKDRKNRPKIKACAVSDREGGDGGRSPVPQLSSTYNSEGVVYLRMRCKAILPTFFQSLWHDVHSSSSSVLASPLLVGNSYVYKLSLSVYVTERETGEYTEAGKTEWSAHTDTSGGGNVDEFIVFRNPVPIVVSCDPRKTSSSSSMPLSSFARSIGYVTNEQDMKMVLYATKHKRKDKSKHIPFHSREGKELRQKVKKVKHRSQPGRFENDEGVNGEHGDHIHSSKRSATGSLSVSPVPVKKKVLGFAYMAVEELFLSKEGKGETVEKGESIPSTVQLVNSWNSNLNTMLAHAKSCIEITAGL